MALPRAQAGSLPRAVSWIMETRLTSMRRTLLHCLSSRYSVDIVASLSTLTDFRPGWHHHHLLSAAPLSIIQASSASCDRRSHWWHPARSHGDGSDPWFQGRTFSRCLHATLGTGCQSWPCAFPLPSWAGGRLATFSQQLADRPQRRCSWNGFSIWPWLRHCLGSLSSIQR